MITLRATSVYKNELISNKKLFHSSVLRIIKVRHHNKSKCKPYIPNLSFPRGSSPVVSINNKQHFLQRPSWMRMSSFSDTMLPQSYWLKKKTEILRETTFWQLGCYPSRVPRKNQRLGYPEENKGLIFITHVEKS